MPRDDEQQPVEQQPTVEQQPAELPARAELMSYLTTLTDPAHPKEPPLYALVKLTGGSLAVTFYTYRPARVDDANWVANVYVEHFNHQARLSYYDETSALLMDAPTDDIALVDDVRELAREAPEA